MKRKIRENNALENYKSLHENRIRLAKDEIDRINESANERNKFINNYHVVRDLQNRTEAQRANLMEAARNDALSTVIKAIYITALEAETLLDENIVLAENMVDKWIQESGGASKILSKCGNNTYLLSRISQIVEDAAEETVKEIEDDTDIDTVATKKAQLNLLASQDEEIKAKMEELQKDIDSAEKTDESEEKSEEDSTEEKKEDDTKSEETDPQDNKDDSDDEKPTIEESDTKNEESKEKSKEDSTEDKKEDESDEGSKEDKSEESEDADPDVEIEFDDSKESKEDGSEEKSEEDSTEEDDEPESEDEKELTDDEVDSSEDALEDDDVNDIVGEPLDPEKDGSTNSVDGEDKESNGKIFDELEKEEDVQKAVDLIRTRVADAEETFIKNNAEDKKKIDELLNKISNNVKAVETLGDKDKTKTDIATESVRECRRKINEVYHNKSLTVFAKMTSILTENILKDNNTRDYYITENGSLDTDFAVQSAKVMYGFLETLNTLQLEKVDEKYIAEILNNM